ncbi:MAG: YceD family protein [Sciscionella sp.]
MSEKPKHTHQRSAGPWIIDTRDLGRSPGTSRAYRRSAEVSEDLGFGDVVGLRKGSVAELDVLAESVLEGVLLTGSAWAQATGECARCLDPLAEEIRVEFTELFAYPGSTTEATTDTDEVSRLVDDLIDLEPTVRDAVVLALPQAPLCRSDCPGLCQDCGAKWAELPADHGHEKMDPRWAALRERFGGSEQDHA